MKKLLLYIIVIFPISSFGQTTSYKYDAVGRLIETNYSTTKKVNYTYDKDGNRIQKIESIVVVIPNSIQENTLSKNELNIYPNPTNSVINGTFFSSEEQDITVSVISITGSVIHTYSFKTQRGSYKFSFNISPLAEGIYNVKVAGKTINTSQKVTVRY